MDDHALLRLLSRLRIGLGVAALLWPTSVLVASGLGERGDKRVKPLVRTVGARELVVGLGTLDALANGGDVSRWAAWNMVCDGTDAIGIVLAWRHVPRLRRVGVLASALAAVAASATSLAAAP